MREKAEAEAPAGARRLRTGWKGCAQEIREPAADQAHGPLGTGSWPARGILGARAHGNLGAAVEQSRDKGRGRSEARGGMGTGRGGPARDPNGWKRCAGVHAGEAPPCVGLNGAPLGTPPIGARAAVPWRPFVGADWSRLPTVWRACLAAQVSGWAACPPDLCGLGGGEHGTSGAAGPPESPGLRRRPPPCGVHDAAAC